MRPRIFGIANWLIQDSLIIKITLIAIPRINLNGNQKIKSQITASKNKITAVIQKHATVKNHAPYLLASLWTNGEDRIIPSGVIEVLKPIILALTPIFSRMIESSGYESPMAIQMIPTEAIAARTPLFIILICWLGSPQSVDHQEKTVSNAGLIWAVEKELFCYMFYTIQNLFDFSINKNED